MLLVLQGVHRGGCLRGRRRRDRRLDSRGRRSGRRAPQPAARHGSSRRKESRTLQGLTQGVRWALCHPKQATGEPRLVVVLGGRDATIDDALDNIGLARFLAASGANLALLIVEGGSSYYHQRRDASDVGQVVLSQLVPMASQRRIDVARPAFTAAPGALDDAADFERNNVLARIGDLKGVPLRVDCGYDDPFYPTDRRFAAQLAWLDEHLR